MPEERMAPHDEAAEDAVIGSILCDEEALKDAELDPAMFFSEKNRLAFAAIKRLAARGIGINQITVANELATAEELDKVGTHHLAYVVSACPTSLHCRHYAAIVREQYIRRTIIGFAGKVAQAGYGSPDIWQALSEVDTELTGIRKSNKKLEVISPGDRFEIMLKEYSERNERVDRLAVKTGINRLDLALGGGIYPGELAVLGARPGIGKTTLLQYIANKMGDAGHPVLFASAEMTVSGLTDRDMAEVTGLPLWQIRAGKYEDAVFGKIVQAMGPLAERNVWYLPRGGMTTTRIATAADMVRNRAGNLRLIVVDHLGRLRPSSHGRPRHIELGEMTSELADLAKEMECPVLLACQLNRGLEDRDDKRPTLSDLRESGRIEEDADVVMFLYRKGFYLSDPYNETEVIVAKLRQSDDAQRKAIRVQYERTKGFIELGP